MRALAVAAAAALLSLAPARGAAAQGWFLPQGRVNRAATPAERQWAATFVRDARRALRRWGDPAQAMKAGYEPQSEGTVAHYVDPARLLEGGESPDPARPTALVWVVTDQGPRLAGAMWMMASADTPGPDLGGPLAPWHAHVDCRSASSARAIAAGRRCRPGETREVTPEMLHVWLAGVADPFAPDMATPVTGCRISGAAAS